jgi:hypothetical protein
LPPREHASGHIGPAQQLGDRYASLDSRCLDAIRCRYIHEPPLPPPQKSCKIFLVEFPSIRHKPRMSEFDLASALGREASVSDQPPGFYKWRAGRKRPTCAVRISFDGEFWSYQINGKAAVGSPARDPLDIPFVLRNAPFWPIDEREYLTIRAAWDADDSIFTDPYEPINLRGADPL